MNKTTKTVNLLLQDGDLNGIIQVEDSAWNLGEMYASPRESVSELVATAKIDKYGVYLLLSDEQVYVGQSSNLKKRIKEHLAGKDWWTRAVLLTTKGDCFDSADIDYMESVLIGKAGKNKSLSCDNHNKGNDPKVNKFKKIILDQFLDEALFLMELIGVSVFSKQCKKPKKKQPVEHNDVGGSQDSQNDQILLYYAEKNGDRWHATCKCSKSMIEKNENPIPCLVLSGSKVSITFTNSCFDSVKKQRQEYAEFIDENGVLTKDIMFSSSSTAAMFVSGASKNGLTCWKDKDGVTLKELVER